MKTINRQAIILRFAKPMLDWIRQVDIDLGNEPLDEKDIGEEATIYLIPDSEDPRHARKYLKKHFLRIFERELEDWYVDEDLWPQKRTWKVFEQWFDYEITEMVWDLAGKAIRHDRF